MKKDYISQRSNGYRDYCGIGNIIIPKSVDPIKYIARCFRTGTASIVLEDGGVIDNVIISKSALRDIYFPENNDYKKLGSQVVWINKPRINQPIIIGVFNKNNEFVDLSQTSDVFGKSTSSAVAKIMADSQNGIVVVSCSSQTQSGGDIYIISTNRAKSSKLVVNVSGEINISSAKINVVGEESFSVAIQKSTSDETKTLISYEQGKGLSYKDEFENEIYVNRENIQMVPIGKFNIGEGVEPIPLGTSLKTQLEKTNQLLENLLIVIRGTPIPEAGNGAPSSFQAALVAAISTNVLGDFSNILSKISNTD